MFGKSLIGLVFVVLLLGTSSVQAEPSERSLNVQSADCYSNCATLVRTGKHAHVVAKDANGSIFKVIALELPADARLDGTVESVTGIELLSSTNTDGTTVTQRTDKFYTSTHWVIVTYTFCWDADGNLIDMDVKETRFPHKEQER